MTRGPDNRIRAVSDAGLVVLYAFTGVALIGFATFGLHPNLLAEYPQFAGFYSISFNFFAQAQIWLAGAVLALFLTSEVGSRWIPAFAMLYLISLGSELLGTGTGIPFGDYRYTEALGAKWFGHVPVVIPVSWFFMAVPSYALARWAIPRQPVVRVLLASLLLLSWDLALDPAMSAATAYWVWEEPGAYHGMPWLNLFGWYITGLMLMAALALLGSDEWMKRLRLRWLVVFYGANLLLPVGMSVLTGLWSAVFATVAVLAVVALAVGAVRWRRPAGDEIAGVTA